MRRPRILLADDHRLLREAFTQLLEPACHVVGTVADGRALLAAAPNFTVSFPAPVFRAREFKAGMPVTV
jgi:CheY-like chemotaxis protein